MALDSADDAQRDLVAAGVGRADLTARSLDALRAVIRDTGALDAVEKRISTLAGAANAALRDAIDLDQEAHEVLAALVEVTTARDA